VTAGLERDAIGSGRGAGALAIVVKRLTDRAAEHLDCARRLEIPRAARPALLLAAPARLYLRRLARARHNPFDRRLQAPDPWAVPRLILSHRFGIL